MTGQTQKDGGEPTEDGAQQDGGTDDSQDGDGEVGVVDDEEADHHGGGAREGGAEGALGGERRERHRGEDSRWSQGLGEGRSGRTSKDPMTRWTCGLEKSKMRV